MSSIKYRGTNTSNPKTILKKPTKYYCSTVYSLDNKFCNQYTIREFLESPKESQDSPIQLFNQFQLAMENNPPPNSFTPPQKKNLLQTVFYYLKNEEQDNTLEYDAVSMSEDIIDNSFTQSPYKSMIFNLDN